LDTTHTFFTTWNNYGSSGTPISGLQRGQWSLFNFDSSVTAVGSIATTAGDTLVLMVILFVEGEAILL